MRKNFCLSKDLLPQIPVPHDGVIKSIHIEKQCLVFDFDDDISSYDSVAYWFPQAKTLTIRYHFSEDLFYSIYKWVKPNLFFKNGGYKYLTDESTDKNHSTLLNLTKSGLEYIDHHVGYGYGGYSLFIDLYSATKGAVNSFAKAMALEVAKQKMRVNCIQPGFIPSQILEKSGIEADQFIKFYAERHPLGFGTRDDIGYACVYLLSDAARWVTGSIFTIDGGYTLQ